MENRVFTFDVSIYHNCNGPQISGDTSRKRRRRTVMKIGALISSAALFMTVAATANAADVKWNLQNVVFSDGGVATGWFTRDSSTGLLTNFDITTTAGYAVQSGFHYTPPTSSQYAPSSWDSRPSLSVSNSDGRWFLFVFIDPLPASGVDVLAPGNFYGTAQGSWEAKPVFNGRNVISGQVSSAPEPAAWSLMILGVGGMGAALRTRRRKAVAA
jgi:MYXO-CTERM domain-containing protein